MASALWSCGPFQTSIFRMFFFPHFPAPVKCPLPAVVSPSLAKPLSYALSADSIPWVPHLCSSVDVSVGGRLPALLVLKRHQGHLHFLGSASGSHEGQREL